MSSTHGNDVPKTMRQAVITAPTRFEVVTADVPRLQSDDEILIRTAACGICSGDLMPWYLAKKVGTVLGHEVVGWVHTVGTSISGFEPGDLVFVHHHAPCGECPACARGDVVHCATWRSSQLEPGGMAEFIRVPAVNVRHDTFIVSDLAPEVAIFIEPLGCSVKALKKVLPETPAAGRYPQSAAVVGCGVMGLLNLAVARVLSTLNKQALELIAVEPDAHRRQRALTFGATFALTPEEAASSIRDKVDFVVIGPGSGEVVRQALTYVRPGGTALLFTPTPTGELVGLDLGDLYFREIRLVPSYSCGPDDTRHAYRLLRHGWVQPAELVTHRFPLEDVQTAYETARQGGAALKVMIEM